jgi:hypothetical protein
MRRVGAVEVRALVQCVHLVQAHVLEALVVGLERIDDGDRLAVGHRHDDVGARGDVREHVLCGPGARPGDCGWHGGELR